MIATTSANISVFASWIPASLDIVFKAISAIFSGITVFLLYKTYIRAKNTIFQPFHQEALKRQIGLFEKILEDIPSGLIKEPIDYKETLELNIKKLKGESPILLIGAMVETDCKKTTLDRIYISNNLSDYLNRLQKYIVNPLIPDAIKTILEQIETDIYKNLKIKMCEFFTVNNKNLSKLDTIGLWNDFNHMRIMHEDNFDKLRNEIHKFLKVNTMN